MKTEQYPPISSGTIVRTTQENHSLHNGWTDECLAKRQWGVQGTILNYHDSHGLCYDVQHEDGTQGCYDPSEVEIVKQ